MSYRRIFYQIVFGFKEAKTGYSRNTFIFSDLHPTVSLSNCVRDIKIASSIWMNADVIFQSLEPGETDGFRRLLIESGIEFVKNICYENATYSTPLGLNDRHLFFP